MKKWKTMLVISCAAVLGAGIRCWAAEAGESEVQAAEAEEGKESTEIKQDFVLNGVSVHDPSIIKADGMYYIFGSHMDSAKSADLKNWEQFTTGVDANNLLFDNLFDGVEEGDPAAFTFVGKNTENWYSVWAPKVIYNKAMGKYVMYFCTTSSYIKSNICFATADNVEGPYHYVDTFLYSGYTYGDCKDGTMEQLMGTSPKPYTGASYDNNNWPNCIDPDVFYDEDGKMWMVYGSWSGGIFLIQIDEETGYPIYPEADEENHVDSYYGKKLLGGYHNPIEGPHITYDPVSGYYYLFLSYGRLQAKGGYQIRLFRCDTVDGTYVDAAGQDMYTFVNQEDYGLKMMGNYILPSLSNNYLAPGGQSAFIDDDGEMYVAYHQRMGKMTEYHEPRVHQLFRNKENWLVAAPFAANGETLKEDGYSAEEVAGTYSYINHGTDISAKTVRPEEIRLNEDGTVTGGETGGTWELEEGTPYIFVTIGDVTYSGVMIEMEDEAGNHTLCFTAAGNNNETIWGVSYR